jgi:excisionase family DNA binding protein
VATAPPATRGSPPPPVATFVSADGSPVSISQPLPEQEDTVNKLLLTPEEAAEALGICRSKVYELLRAGSLDSVRIGTSRRVPCDALIEFVDALRQRPIRRLA